MRNRVKFIHFNKRSNSWTNIFRGNCRTLIFRLFCMERNFNFAYGTNFGISRLVKPCPTKPRRIKWGMLGRPKLLFRLGVRGEALKTASSGAALGASLSPTHYTAPCPTKPYVAMASFCHQSSRAERRWVQPPDAENGGGVGGSRCAIAVIRPDKPLAPAG